MDAELQRLQSRLAEVTKALRADRNRLTNLERFEATTALQSVVASAPPTPQRPSSSGLVAAARRIPTEMTAPMMTARDELKAARDATAVLEKAKGRAAAQLQSVLEDTSRVEESAASAAAATDWHSPHARHYRAPLERKSAVASLQKEVARLHAAEADAAVENKRLGNELSAVSLQLLDLDDLDWELYKAKADVKIHEELAASVEDEIKSIERIYAKKEALLARTLATSNTDAVLMLEADKSVEQARLAKHQAASRDTAASTRHRAVMIMQREEKLKFYGDAIRTVLNVDEGGGDDVDDDGHGAGGPKEHSEEEEGVPAEDIDEIRKAIASARRQDGQLQAQLEFLDAQIGNLEARVDILVRATMTLETDEQREAEGHGRRVAAVDRAYRQQLQAADGMVATQRDAIDAKTAKLHAIRAKSEDAQNRTSEEA